MSVTTQVTTLQEIGNRWVLNWRILNVETLSCVRMSFGRIWTGNSERTPSERIWCAWNNEITVHWRPQTDKRIDTWHRNWCECAALACQASWELMRMMRFLTVLESTDCSAFQNHLTWNIVRRFIHLHHCRATPCRTTMSANTTLKIAAIVLLFLCVLWRVKWRD